MGELAVPDPLLGEWFLPLVGGETLRVEARAGEVLCIVGPNGSGKSALVTWMATQTAASLRRILAQRRLWLEHSGPSITSKMREQQTSNANHYEKRPESRYLEQAGYSRTSVVLFDLLGRIHDEDRRANTMFESGATRDEVAAAMGPRVLATMNTVLQHAGLHFELDIQDGQVFVARHSGLGTVYPIFQLSDGERSALLLAGEVLTTPPGTVIMIDEPERHLHRSISAGLITAVVDATPDCAFVVLTHDLDLASELASRPGKTISVAAVEWSGENPVAWDLRDASVDENVTEAARAAILGGRRSVVFVEGDDGSLDLALYRALYPATTVVPSGSCDAVIRSVSGLRTSEQHHWISAQGIVDRDGRDESECGQLREKGVAVLAVCEVENLHYVSNVLQAVAQKQADTLGHDAEALVAGAKRVLLEELSRAGTLERFAVKIARDQINRTIASRLPPKIDGERVELSFESPYAPTLARLRASLEGSDYDALIREVPIRDSGAPQQIAVALGFRSAHDYRRAALVAISQAPGLADEVRQLVGASQ